MVVEVDIPLVGLGTWKINSETCSETVYEAIKMGYRHIDCACDYGNEEQVGRGIEKAINDKLVSREELFITSKLWNTYHSKEHVPMALKRTLSDLKLTYLDLYLIHFPISSEYVDFEERYPPGWSIDGKTMDVTITPVPISETWKAMEQLVSNGSVKKIGVCNFNCSLLRDLLAVATIKPYMNQIELHPYLTQQTLINYCKKNSIKVTAFSSFGSLSYIPLGMKNALETPSLLQVEAVKEIAKKHSKSPGQVLLRWATQQDITVIPKSENVERLMLNMRHLKEFDLDDVDMEALNNLNRNLRFNNPSEFADTPIYE